MFFDDDDDERFFNPEIFRVVRREFSTLFDANFEVVPYGVRTVPTHTEDGIPIRKLYVSNLPPKTTRSELFGVFTQYGYIKSCWLRMGEKGPNRVLTPTYAFITFSNPADAHKALQAPTHEKTLRGRHLRISPADTWHQPSEDAEGKVVWNPRYDRRVEASGRNTSNSTEHEEPDVSNALQRPWSQEDSTTTDHGKTTDAAKRSKLLPESSDNAETINSEIDTSDNQEEEVSSSEQCYDMLGVLNQDCLNHVLTFVPIPDLIRSERVSKRWQCMVQEYLEGIRLFKTSWWRQVPRRLTTAMLRHLLARLGNSLTRLHIDHPWSALNDRTAHIVGKFCPNLEELKIVSMHTKNWNPLFYGCKQLKSLSFISCNKLTDSSLVHLVKNNSSIESVSVANNTHVTGLFLTGSYPLNLNSLTFYNCYSLQGTVLTAAIDTLPNLTTLRLDVCSYTIWKVIPLILDKLPKLEELSLSEYSSVGTSSITSHSNDDFCKSLSKLSELKVVNFSRNIYITNGVLKHMAQSCPKLQSIDISSCNSRKSSTQTGVGDEGVSAVCGGCPLLTQLDVSYLAALTDGGLASAARASCLTSLIARGIPVLTAEPFSQCLEHCHFLQEIDACGCDNVSKEVIEAAVKALDAKPRKLVLRLAGTANTLDDHPIHKLLIVDLDENTSNLNFRPDFVDHNFEDSSDDSLIDDILEHDEFDDFIANDMDELFPDDNDEEDDLEDYLYRFENYF